MLGQLKPIREWIAPDRNVFEQQILPLGQPAILRDVVKHWPAVQCSNTTQNIRTYFAGLDQGQWMDFVLSAAEHQGLLSYNKGLAGFNFERKKAPLPAVLEELERLSKQKNAPALAIQSVLISAVLPRFLDDNQMQLLDATSQPRLWVGNRVRVPAHFDDAENLACVVAGKRRFVVLPPDQVKNLYIGPLDYAPTGAPVSLVDFNKPDLDAYPDFKIAMQHARVAELGPGDALYIPTLWWHQVESLEDINILVNYWWGGSIGNISKPNSPFDSLLHALLTIKDLPEEKRNAWKAMFDQFVFQTNGDPVAHLPGNKQGIVGKVSPDRVAQVKDWLIKQLQK